MLILLENWLIRFSDRYYFSLFFLAFLLFLKMSYYRYFFHSNLAFTRYKCRIFSSLASLARILENNHYTFSIIADRWKKLNFWFASINVTAITLLKYWVLIFLFNVFQTTFCNDFVLLSLLFYTDNSCFKYHYFSKFLSVLFCVRALDGLINYSFLWILYLKKPFYLYCFTPKITPLSLMIFFYKTFIPILFPFCL